MVLTRIGNQIGIDGCTFEISIPGMCNIIQDRPLINSNGIQYGEIQNRKGKLALVLCLPRYERQDNIIPYRLIDAVKIELLRNDIDVALAEILKANEFNSKLKSIELNITKETHGKSTCNDVIKLMNNSFLNQTKQNKLFVTAEQGNPLKQVIDGVCTHTVRGQYILKAYNKSKKEGIKKKEILRIELVLQNKQIKKLFGDKVSLKDILNNKSIISLLECYRDIFINDVIEKHIKNHLNLLVERLFEDMTCTDSPTETFIRYKEVITDIKILEKAIKKWKNFRGNDDDFTRQLAFKIKTQYGVPQDVLKTIKEFRKSC